MVTAMQMQQRIVPTVDAAIPEPAPVEIVLLSSSSLLVPG